MRFTVYILGIFCFFLAVAPILAADETKPAEAQNKIVTLLKQSELKYIQVPDKDIYLVLIAADNQPDIKQWRVFINFGGEKQEYIAVWATMIDRSDNYEFTSALVDKVLTYNTGNYGPKLIIDKLKGDLDSRWEMPTEFTSVELLKFAIMNVAAVCNELYTEYNQLTPVSSASTTK